MKNRIHVSEVRFNAASPKHVRNGLLGFVSAIVNGAIKIDGVALRRTLDRRVVLSFPARTDSLGRRHCYFSPIDDTSRREIERQVFRALGLEPRSGKGGAA